MKPIRFRPPRRRLESPSSERPSTTQPPRHARAESHLRESRDVRSRVVAVAIAPMLLVSGCGGLFAKGDSLAIRYYSPERASIPSTTTLTSAPVRPPSAAAESTATAAATGALPSTPDPAALPSAAPSSTESAEGHASSATAHPRELRLGRVRSGPNLRERILHRDTEFESGYYEDRRWTELPEEYVRRALERSLFETGGLERSVGNRAPALDVEVLAFDEIRTSRPTFARVQLRMMITSGRSVLVEQTMTVDRPMTADNAEALAAAMAQALEEAARVVTDRTVATIDAADADRR